MVNSSSRCLEFNTQTSSTTNKPTKSSEELLRQDGTLSARKTVNRQRLAKYHKDERIRDLMTIEGLALGRRKWKATIVDAHET
jgi:hypothetical protein